MQVIRRNLLKSVKPTDTIFTAPSNSFQGTMTLESQVKFFIPEGKKFDEPFFIANLSWAESQVDLWNELLPDVTPYYAMKCNTDARLLEMLVEKGVHFDCASKAEMEKIGQYFNEDELNERLIFANPVKFCSHLDYAKEKGIMRIVVDSPEELDKVVEYHPEANILIRIKTDDSAALCQFSTKFGADLNEVVEIIEKAKELDLNLLGVSFHVGSGSSDANIYRSTLEDVRTVFDIAKEYGYKMNTVDIGGGFSGNCQTDPNDRALFEQMTMVINEALEDLGFKDGNHDLIGEPGRYIASNYRTLAIPVVGKKLKKNEEFGDEYVYYVGDGIYGNFNNIIYDHYELNLEIVNGEQFVGKDLYPTTLFGCTCDSLDKLTLHSGKIQLPELEVGDWLYVPQFGAYTNEASVAFNGFSVDTCHYIWS